MVKKLPIKKQLKALLFSKSAGVCGYPVYFLAANRFSSVECQLPPKAKTDFPACETRF